MYMSISMLLFWYVTVLGNKHNLPPNLINHDAIYETLDLLGETAGLLAFGSGPAPAAAGHELGD